MFTTVKYEYADLFLKDKADKELMIVSDDGLINISGTELHSQQFELSESLCSESELRFGSCEASMIKFTVNNVFIDMTGKWLTVIMIVEGHADKPFQIGRYKVFSDTASGDRTTRDVVAYDATYDIINADAASMARWYNEVLPNANSTITLWEFRTRFISYFGLEQVLPQDGLVNDDMIVEKTIEPEQISGKDIVTAICEINGCFGHIGRDGKFYYIYLTQNIEGLYPRNDLFPSNNIFPKKPVTSPVGAKGSYISVDWKDFKTKTINKLQIRQAENDIGTIIGEGGDNCYIIENNFLVYGKSSEELWRIGNNIFNKITKIIYRPLIEAGVKGNPCFEVGDPIRIVTKHKLIETYILQRTLKGIQALRDSYKSEGVEKYSEQVNGVHKSIIQLKGKTNTITRTVEENRLEMLDIEAGLSFTIVETAKGLQANIEAEQHRAEGEETKLSTQIELTAEGLKADITKETERAEGEEEKLSNSIKVTAEGLQANIDAETKRAGEAEEQLSTDLSLTATGLQLNIDAETKRAGEAEKSLGTDIEALAGKIVLKVKANGEMALVELSADPEDGTLFKVKADNISLTAAQAMQLLSGGTLNLTALDINIKSDKWTVDKYGNAVFNDIKCNNIKAFSISTEAKGDFNSEVSDSEAMRLAREAIAAAQAAADAAASAAAKAQSAANVANTTVNNLVNTVIPDINSAIQNVSNRVTALENK